MKYLFSLLATLVLLGTLSAASAAEPGGIAPASLSKMGLGNLQVMSDQEGQAVRGTLVISFSRVTVSNGITTQTKTGGGLGSSYSWSFGFAIGGGTIFSAAGP